MKKLIMFSIILSLLPYSLALSTVINVPADYPAIQQGINASIDGDTVLVQPGTYVENINFNGHNIVLGSLFLTTGDISYISQTILDGDSADHVVTFENGEDGTAVIAGFTIRNGHQENHGGGIHCINFSSPVIKNNIICENRAGSFPYYPYGYGGGINCMNSSPYIFNNIICDNNAGYGSGIRCYNSNPLISGNIIRENTAYINGGGIYCQEFSFPVICNNILTDNSADLGGGLSSLTYSEPVICNTLFWSDSALIEGAEIALHFTAAVNISYSNIQDTLWPGVGNVSIDPLFRDPVNFDFHLMSVACGDSADSPCIDAGDPNILDSLLDCSWGLGSSRSDMGAYGGGDSLVSAIFDEYIPTPGRFMLLQNYPNPFNASTSIRFILPESQNVSLIIYDLLGRRVEILLDEYKQAGVHSVTFDASHLSSGVYFYRLQAGGRIETKRMVLLK